MYKHDEFAVVQSSRSASRRLHRRPLTLERTMAPAPSGRGHPWRLRRALESGQAAAILNLLDAETRIEELETALSAARAAAFTDALTGALNRRGFDDAYQRELARARRNGSPLALAMIDLDDFKRLNDTLGHQVGDEALVHLVRALRNALRPSDILCRFGGEEFLVLLPATALAEAAAAVSRCQRQFAREAVPGREIVVTFSAGVVVQDSAESLEHSLLRADAATYAAKRAGKNCVVTG